MPLDDILGSITDESEKRTLSEFASTHPEMRTFFDLGEQVYQLNPRLTTLGYDGKPEGVVSELERWRRWLNDDQKGWKFYEADRARIQEALDESMARVSELEAAELEKEASEGAAEPSARVAELEKRGSWVSRIKPILYASVPSVVLLTVLFAWLFRYDIREDRNGSALRVDRFTGEVARIENGEVSILRVASEDKSPPTPLRTWPQIQVPTLQTGARLATRWRNGQIGIRLKIAPYSARIKAAHANYCCESWNLDFEDADGFTVFTHQVSVRSMTTIMGADNEVDSLEFKDSLPLSRYDYNRITGVNVGWAGWN